MQRYVLFRFKTLHFYYALHNWVETQFIGLKNGILDQSANVLSMDNQLMVMDCLSNEHEMIQKGAHMPEFEVVVVYSGISKQID